MPSYHDGHAHESQPFIQSSSLSLEWDVMHISDSNLVLFFHHLGGEFICEFVILSKAIGDRKFGGEIACRHNEMVFEIFIRFCIHDSQCYDFRWCTKSVNKITDLI